MRIQTTPLVLASLLTAAFAGTAARATERAAALKLTDDARDTIVFRLPDGSGVGEFIPGVNGRYDLRLHLASGPDIRSLALGDVDGDSVTDMVVTRGDGALVLWKGMGAADFTSDLVEPDPHAHEMHAGHHMMSAEPPALVGDAREHVVAALAVHSVRTDAPARSLADARSAAADFADAARDIAWITREGRLEALGAAGRVGVPLPAGFVPRLVTSGHLGVDGRPALAVIGEGTRPRLAIVTRASASSWQAREVLNPFTTFTVQVAQAGFTFSPSTVTIQPNDTVHWVWDGINHTVTSGSSCTANNLFCSPSNTSCATAATSNTGATYDHTFPSAGSFPYYCRIHCTFGMTGTVTVQAAPTNPGSVPDRSPAVPLTLNKAAGGDLNASWGGSCSSAATDYGIYEGSLPIVAYDHKSLVCPAGTATTATFTPSAGNQYYLVVPRTAIAEGSYGKDSANHEIPPGSTTCIAGPQDLTACP